MIGSPEQLQLGLGQRRLLPVERQTNGLRLVLLEKVFAATHQCAHLLGRHIDHPANPVVRNIRANRRLVPMTAIVGNIGKKEQKPLLCRLQRELRQIDLADQSQRIRLSALLDLRNLHVGRQVGIAEPVAAAHRRIFNRLAQMNVDR